MARSRTSGTQSAAEKALWERRRGNPGGARSEGEKLGEEMPSPPLPLAERAVTPEIVAAFLARDKGRLRELLGIEPWEDGPWVAAPCESAGHGPGWGSCRCAALALRARILAAIEQGPGTTTEREESDGGA